MSESEVIQDGEKAVVILLAGFLGSGKTTLLKQILSWETDLSDTVVLVNEFGDVGIDGALLKNSGSDRNQYKVGPARRSSCDRLPGRNRQRQGHHRFGHQIFAQSLSTHRSVLGKSRMVCWGVHPHYGLCN